MVIDHDTCRSTRDAAYGEGEGDGVPSGAGGPVAGPDGVPAGDGIPLARGDGIPLAGGDGIPLARGDGVANGDGVAIGDGVTNGVAVGVGVGHGHAGAMVAADHDRAAPPGRSRRARDQRARDHAPGAGSIAPVPERIGQHRRGRVPELDRIEQLTRRA